jgi:RNA polymerase sigma-70 factor, ECF subfamily
MSKRHLIREETPGPSVESGVSQIERLSRTHGTYLLGLARKLCRRHHDPEDLVQDTYVRAIASPVPDGANERAWLSRVMHNLFIDWIRRRDARREDELTDLPATAPAEAEAWWLSLTHEEIMRVVDQLPEEQRIAFKLFTFDGKSYDEIAAAQGIAKATVGTRILRARVRIREILVEERGHA